MTEQGLISEIIRDHGCKVRNPFANQCQKSFDSKKRIFLFLTPLLTTRD